MVVSARRDVGLRRWRQPRGEAVRRARALLAAGAAAPSRSTATSRTRRRTSTACSAAAARSPCCSSRCPSYRPWRSSASATSASSSPGSCPATTSTCTWSTPAPSTWTPRRSAALDRRRRRRARAPCPGAPELVLAELPPGTHVLVMTHDHAEDVALCDAASAADHLGPIGLIGSSAKWARFRPAARRPGTRRSRRPDPHARSACPGITRQGAGRHRGRGGRRAARRLRARSRPSAVTP